MCLHARKDHVCAGYQRRWHAQMPLGGTAADGKAIRMAGHVLRFACLERTGLGDTEKSRYGRRHSPAADSSSMTTDLARRQRWLALILLCLGDLMIVLDITIVNVALPSISTDLAFTPTALVWVVNAYALTYGGFLLLGGRLGDLYGYRRLYLIGIAFFSAASLACGVSNSQEMLIAARAVQGLGGAVVSAVAMALIMNIFTETEERTKAMGVFGFVMAGGGSLGAMLGGILVDNFHWHAIFLVNVPAGFVVYVLCVRMLPADRGGAAPVQLDLSGALTITLSLMLAVYAVVNGNVVGWSALQTVGMLTGSGVLLAAFLWIEAHAKSPLVPLSLFRLRNLTIANVTGALWSAAMFSWFFIAALYMQLVLAYTPMQVGLAFLPINIIMAAFSLGLSAWMVLKFGLRLPLALGFLLTAVGLFLFALAPVNGDFWWHVLPGMLLLGLGAGMAFNPVLLAAMDGVRPEDSGLASGVMNTSFMMGGALGLAVLVSLAAARTETLAVAGTEPLYALNGGYQFAFFVAAICAVLGVILALWLKPAAPSAVAPPTATH